jgi:hypothetical protein
MSLTSEQKINALVAIEVAAFKAEWIASHDYISKTRLASKNYYNANKSKILSKMKVRYSNKRRNVITCSCKGKYTNYSKIKHELTKKHIKYLKKN